MPLHRTNGRSYPTGNQTARPVTHGVSVSHQKLTKSQRAVAAANVLDGISGYQPTQVDMSKAFGVSIPMIAEARRLSPAARERIAKGKATLATFKVMPTTRFEPAVENLFTALHEAAVR